VSDWIAGWLRERGVEARLDDFEFRKTIVRDAAVFVKDRRIDGTPLHDAGATGPAGIEGRILVLQDPDPAALDEALDNRTARGLVIVTGDPEGEVVLRNAERLESPWKLPVLQVARRDAAPLLAGGASIRLVVVQESVPAKASNVVADLPAPGGEGTVVLMTPKSGWFQCAAERGGGIAIAMALCAHAASLPERRRHLRVLFTSGHELGHLGLRAYLARNPGLRGSADFWLHLGASIGARNADGMRVFAREESMRQAFMASLRRHGAGPAALADRDLRPHGESREVFERPFLSLAGRHPYFHSPQDLPTKSVDAESVARHAAAFGELLEQKLR
jgi:hypothetical protein